MNLEKTKEKYPSLSLQDTLCIVDLNNDGSLMVQFDTSLNKHECFAWTKEHIDLTKDLIETKYKNDIFCLTFELISHFYIN